MKKNLPLSVVINGHRDFQLLSAVAADVTQRAGGNEALAEAFSTMLRECVDDVIMTPKTGRRSYDELEKTEKMLIST